MEPLKLCEKKKTRGDSHIECPVCKGHGEYLLGPEVTVKMHCSQCNGWGWVKEGSPDALCIHKMKFSHNIGRCYNRYVCEKCGRVDDIDSSD